MQLAEAFDIAQILKRRAKKLLIIGPMKMRVWNGSRSIAILWTAAHVRGNAAANGGCWCQKAASESCFFIFQSVSRDVLTNWLLSGAAASVASCRRPRHSL